MRGSSKVKLFFQLLAKKRKLSPFYLGEEKGGRGCSFHMPVVVAHFITQEKGSVFTYPEHGILYQDNEFHIKIQVRKSWDKKKSPRTKGSQNLLNISPELLSYKNLSL